MSLSVGSGNSNFLQQAWLEIWALPSGRVHRPTAGLTVGVLVGVRVVGALVGVRVVGALVGVRVVGPKVGVVVGVEVGLIVAGVFRLV